MTAKLLILGVVCSQIVQGQSLTPGARVRVMSGAPDETRQIGSIVSVRGDGVVFRREVGGDTVSINYAQMTEIDVSAGRHRHPWAGLAIGLGGGAVIGAIWGATMSGRGCGSGHGTFCGLQSGSGFNIAAGALLCAIPGAVIGVITGSLVQTERWRKVPLAMSVSSAAGGRPVMRIGARF